MAIKKSIIEKTIKNNLEKFLSEYGFEFKRYEWGDYAIARFAGDQVDSFYVIIQSMIEVSISRPVKRLNQVEDILYIITKENKYNQANPTIGIRSYSSPVFHLVENNDHINSLCEDFKIKFLEEYLPELDKYSDPLEILLLWDSLNNEQRNSVFSDPHKYSKIVIIAKLYALDRYEAYCEEFRSYFQTNIANGIRVPGSTMLLRVLNEVILYLDQKK